MSKIFRILSGLLGAVLMVFISVSCSETVDVNTVGPPVNVVYSLLDPGESKQYVRIGRSYNSSSQSNSKSPHPDSISWTINFSVYMEEWGKENELENIYYFNPDSEIVKDSGFFPVEGLAVYSASFIPKPLHTYSIYVHFNTDDKISSARTTIPGDLVVHDPKPIPGRKINLQQDNIFTIRWVPVENAGVYQSFFKIFYREKTDTNIDLNVISFNSQIFTEFTSTQLLEKTINGNRFFDEVLHQVDSTREASREIINVSFEMLIGGEDFGLFLFTQLNGNNLSSSINNYTNITNGIGIFSSLELYRVSNLELSNATLDELAYSEKTRALGFLDHYGKRE